MSLPRGNLVWLPTPGPAHRTRSVYYRRAGLELNWGWSTVAQVGLWAEDSRGPTGTQVPSTVSCYQTVERATPHSRALVCRVETCFVKKSEVKRRVMLSFKMILLLMTLSIVSPLYGAVTFKDGAYSGVQIKIDENLPAENCREILENLEVIIVNIK